MRVLMAHLPTLPALTLRKMGRAHRWGTTPRRHHRRAGQMAGGRVPFRENRGQEGTRVGLGVCVWREGPVTALHHGHQLWLEDESLHPHPSDAPQVLTSPAGGSCDGQGEERWVRAVTRVWLGRGTHARR